jgi:predicted porin
MCLVAALTLMAGVALAGDMSYQVYGVAHVSTDLQNNGDESEIYVSSNTSRVGIKGSLDTDSDLFTVIFQYENQADFNNNGNEAVAWSNRNSFAGLKGDWGKLMWGRYDTPYKSIGRSVEFFPERIGDARNATTLTGWDRRENNMIMYATPVLGEIITVTGQYVPDQGVEDGALFSASAVYDKEKIMAGVAFENHGKALEDAYDSEDPDASEASTGIRAVLRYKGDKFGAAGFYQTISNIGGYKDFSAQTIGLGANFLLTPVWDLKGQYYMTDPNTDGDDDGASMLTLGIDYILSAQARLYVAYATMMNEDNSNYFDPFHGGHGQSIALADTDEPGSPDVGTSPYGASIGLVVAW